MTAPESHKLYLMRGYYASTHPKSKGDVKLVSHVEPLLRLALR